MRCLVVSPVFPPEPVVSSQTTAHVAEAMAGRGHDVTVVTSFPSRPAGRIYPGYSRRACSRRVEPNGIELVRCFSLLSSTSSMASRFLENLSFGVTSGWIALTTRRPDVIYANSWPIFATGILAAVARLRGIPLVISVQDVYPESLVSQGRIRPEGRIVRLLRSIDRLIVRSCRAVIVISESFADIYRSDRGVPSERLHVVPNWVDAGSVEPDSDLGRRYRSQRGLLPDAFVVAYGGNVGAAAGVECVIEAMRSLDDIPRLRLLVAGEGTNLHACRELARRIGGDRVLFHAPYRLEENSMVLGAADVLVLPTRGKQSLASVPSKLLAYMLAGRPIVAATLRGSDLAATIERSGCGWVVEPDRPESLSATLREVSGLGADDLRRRGLAGRDFALRNFTREACLPRVVGIVEAASRLPVDQRITSSTVE